MLKNLSNGKVEISTSFLKKNLKNLSNEKVETLKKKKYHKLLLTLYQENCSFCEHGVDESCLIAIFFSRYNK